MKCPECGREVPGTNRFCTKCGAKLPTAGSYSEADQKGYYPNPSVRRGSFRKDYEEESPSEESTGRGRGTFFPPGRRSGRGPSNGEDLGGGMPQDSFRRQSSSQKGSQDPQSRDMPQTNSGEGRGRGTSSRQVPEEASSSELRASLSLMDHYYIPNPRKRIPLNPEEIVIEPPPAPLGKGQAPMLLRMGSSMVMGVNSMLNGNMTMVLSSLLFPLLNQRYTEEQKEEYEEKREKFYSYYLEVQQKKILTEVVREQSILCENYPELEKVMRYPMQGKNLWNRKKTDDDFLSLRIGHGSIPMSTKLTYQKRSFDMEEDHLLEEMYQVCEAKYQLEDAPVMLSLIDNPVVGVTGREEDKNLFFLQVLLRLTILFAYDEVKTVFLLSPEQLRKLNFLRFLPHVWNDDKSFRLLATNSKEAFQVGEYLQKELGGEKVEEKEWKEAMKRRPYYVIFSFDRKMFEEMEVLKSIMSFEKNIGFSILTLFEDVPKECSSVVYLRPSGEHTLTAVKNLEKEDMTFRLDSLDIKQVKGAVSFLCNRSLRVKAGAFSLPKMITFLDMFKVGNIEQLDIEKRWKDSNPVATLAAPVGVGTDGELFYLDLHEKFQGPHGLVAGMTGSGKSEFIITYILSMAVNYHPDEVAFILIDYKGGGLAGAFENPDKGIYLPHLMGTITNLDGGAISHSLMSIESELKRRQFLFKDTASQLSEGTMDIYTYQKLYRMGKVKEACPHLFIVCDEFAELRTDQSEFMNKLISAARIGRSLGVHLILATQKPSGVVNDQINSNTKFRVCLKVQDGADSNEMIKRPDAAQLKETGRFYLLVGFNEYFALGQSAWCGAPYLPKQEFKVSKGEEILFVDNVGQTIHLAKPEVEKTGQEEKQIVAIVKAMSRIAEKNNIPVRKLWTPPLEKSISFEQMSKMKGLVQEPVNEEKTPGKGDLAIPMGVIDDATLQRQFPFILHFPSQGHLLLMAPGGMGKSTFLESLVFSAAEHYSPEEVNFYLIDSQSGGLRPFASLPHCGAYLKGEDVDDMDNLFSLLDTIVEERKKVFEEALVSGFEAYIEEHKMPLIFVIIDNIAIFQTTDKGKNFLIQLGTYLRLYGPCGIRFCVTLTSSNDLTFRVKQEFSFNLGMQLGAPYEYGELFGKRPGFIPAAVPGRGLLMFNGRFLEFHTAVSYEGEERERRSRIRYHIEELKEKYQGMKEAMKVPSFDETQEFLPFIASFAGGRFPLGYSLDTKRPVVLPLKQMDNFCLYFGNPDGVRPIVENLECLFQREKMKVIHIRRNGGSLFSACPHTEDIEEENAVFLDSTKEDMKILCDYLFETIDTRGEKEDSYCEENNLPLEGSDQYRAAFGFLRDNFQPVIVYVERFDDFTEALEDTTKEEMAEIISGCSGILMYFVGAFYPGMAKALNMDKVFRAFKDSLGHGLLFGGQLDQQGIFNMPGSYSRLSEMLEDYNRGFMYYREKFYPILMPCGVLSLEDQDEDEKSIF